MKLIERNFFSNTNSKSLVYVLWNNLEDDVDINRKSFGVFNSPINPFGIQSGHEIILR